MYDAKNEAHEFTGTNRAEAIEKACQFYSVDADALKVAGFPDGAVYGLATRTVIVAIPKDATPSPSSNDSDGNRGGDRGRGRDRNRGGDRGGRGGGRDRDDRGPRGGRNDRGGRGDRPRQESRSEEARPQEPRPQPSGEPSVGTVQGEVGDIAKFVLGVMERMCLGPFEITEGEENELTVVEVKGEAAKALAANEGRTVDALQLLANQVASLNGPDNPRVVIDIEGNADAREEFLAKLADRVAKRALQTGRPVALDPMNGRDRRTIHIALRERDDVATMSEGEGRYRQVVVVPEGADEFEEAAQQSKDS